LATVKVYSRCSEKTWNFQYQLWLEKQSLANAMNTPAEQFTYGSILLIYGNVLLAILFSLKL